MKLLLIAALSLISISASASASDAPFSEYYGKYSIESCNQSGGFSIANICSGLESVALLFNENATLLMFNQQDAVRGSSGFGTWFGDGLGKPGSSYTSELGTDQLIEQLDDEATTMETVKISRLPNETLSIVYSQNVDSGVKFEMIVKVR